VQHVPEAVIPAVLLNATAGPFHGLNSTAPFDVAQAYADYYFVEALLRLYNLEQGKPLPLLMPTRNQPWMKHKHAGNQRRAE